MYICICVAEFGCPKGGINFIIIMSCRFAITRCCLGFLVLLLLSFIPACVVNFPVPRFCRHDRAVISSLNCWSITLHAPCTRQWCYICDPWSAHAMHKAVVLYLSSLVRPCNAQGSGVISVILGPPMQCTRQWCYICDPWSAHAV